MTLEKPEVNQNRSFETAKPILSRHLANLMVCVVSGNCWLAGGYLCRKHKSSERER